MKNNKNRSFWVLLGAGILCLLCAVLVYCFGGVLEELTDALSYRQTGNGGKITNDTFISQSFKCNHDNVKGLTFRVSTLWLPSHAVRTPLKTASSSRAVRNVVM